MIEIESIKLCNSSIRLLNRSVQKFELTKIMADTSRLGYNNLVILDIIFRLCIYSIIYFCALLDLRLYLFCK